MKTVWITRTTEMSDNYNIWGYRPAESAHGSKCFVVQNDKRPYDIPTRTFEELYTIRLAVGGCRRAKLSMGGGLELCGEMEYPKQFRCTSPDGSVEGTGLKLTTRKNYRYRVFWEDGTVDSYHEPGHDSFLIMECE